MFDTFELFFDAFARHFDLMFLLVEAANLLVALGNLQAEIGVPIPLVSHQTTESAGERDEHGDPGRGTDWVPGRDSSELHDESLG